MTSIFSHLLQTLNAQIGGLRGEGHPQWGSQASDHRDQIRQSIARNLPGLNRTDLSDLTDLQKPPRPDGWCVSISHTQNWGGWMAVRRPVQIGWDVELKARIRVSVVERVSSKKELGDAPRPEFLWCCKEAFFKALEDDQPQTIPELTIADWQSQPILSLSTDRVDGELWTWKGLGPRNGNGLVLSHGPWLIAVSYIL